jgi:hypothetical protein
VDFAANRVRGRAWQGAAGITGGDAAGITGGDAAGITGGGTGLATDVKGTCEPRWGGVQ